jgi:hypothetical protein
MSAREPIIQAEEAIAEAPAAARAGHGVVVGRLVAIADAGRTPLVVHPALAGASAVSARSAVDLHGTHVGRGVVLAFEEGDVLRPIVLGVLRESDSWPLPSRPAQVEADVDGARLVVTARQMLVLRCGAASITLSADGRVSLRGRQITSHADEANRVLGGSVQLN